MATHDYCCKKKFKWEARQYITEMCFLVHVCRGMVSNSTARRVTTVRWCVLCCWVRKWDQKIAESQCIHSVVIRQTRMALWEVPAGMLQPHYQLKRQIRLHLIRQPIITGNLYRILSKICMADNTLGCSNRPLWWASIECEVLSIVNNLFKTNFFCRNSTCINTRAT